MRPQTRPFTVEKKKSRATPARQQADVSWSASHPVALDPSHEPTALVVADRLVGTIGTHVRHVT